MKKIYENRSVYEATQERLKFIFDEFENVYVSFSGGKDSGLILNLCIDYIRKNNLNRKIGVLHQDFEAQYTHTTNFVTKMMTSNLDVIEPFWVCMPYLAKTATSMYEQYWRPWDSAKKDIWVRKMPKYKGVINIENHKFDFWSDTLTQDEFYDKFAVWYHQNISKKGKTICLVGIRTDESLNRWRAITSEKKSYKNTIFTTQIAGDVYTGYPIYDWSVEDVWTAHAKFDFPYNEIYDTFYAAGLTVHQMRVASPFNDWAIGSLNLYRTLEPEIWGSMVGRVNGANFCAIYGGTKAVAWKNIQKPKNHTWKSYVEFLLQTLPEETRKTYEQKFSTSVKFWKETGGVLSKETIAELDVQHIIYKTNGKSNYKTTKERVLFDEYPDEADVKEVHLVPSYKRMAICILKNDHLCKYMGFSQTKAEREKREAAIQKYKEL